MSALVLVVDFLDLPGTETPSSVAAPYIQDFVGFFRKSSFGRFTIDVTVHPAYVHVGKRSTDYGLQVPGTGDFTLYGQDVLGAADPDVDFSPYDMVVAIPAPGIKSIATGPTIAMSAYGQSQFWTHEKNIQNYFVGGDPSLSMQGRKWAWMVHETGHVLGLNHPHSYEGGNDVALNRRGMWSLMDDGFIGSDFYAWDKWLLGWIDDDQVVCIDASQTEAANYTFALSSIETADTGLKMAVVVTSPSTAVILESRRGQGVDAIPTAYEGLVAYTLDMSARETGPIKIISSTRTFYNRYQQPDYVGNLKKGETAAVNRVSFLVTDVSPSIDNVAVTVNQASK